MENIYIKPQTRVILIETEGFFCGSNKTDSASIGGEGSPNEKNQGDISVGGPGVSGSKGRGADLFDDDFDTEF